MKAILRFMVGLTIGVSCALVAVLYLTVLPPPPRLSTPEVPGWIEETRLWQCSDLTKLMRLRYVGDEKHGSFVVECR